MKLQSNLSIRSIQITYARIMAIAFNPRDTRCLLVEVAQHASLPKAALALNMTKGAVSYQIKTFEESLDVKVGC